MHTATAESSASSTRRSAPNESRRVLAHLMASTILPASLVRETRVEAIASVVSHAGAGLPMRVLALVADAGMVLFAIDDLLDEQTLTAEDAALRIEQYTAVARGELCPEVAFDPIARAITDVRRRLAFTDLRGDLLEVWADAMVRMLAGMRAELPGEAERAERDLEAYLDTARDSIGVTWIALTAWIATGAWATRAHLPALQAATRSFATAVRLANDLRTCDRERAEGRVNAVTLVGDDGLADLRDRCDRALADGRAALARAEVADTDQGRFVERFATAIVTMYDTRDFAQAA
ncbi:MAG: terpene synthase family protein [Polyangiales bacterium]